MEADRTLLHGERCGEEIRSVSGRHDAAGVCNSVKDARNKIRGTEGNTRKCRPPRDAKEVGNTSF